MSRKEQRKSLAQWATHKTVLHGPYGEGEGAQDALDQLERQRTATLVWWVLWTMLALIVAFVIVTLVRQ